MRIQFDNKSLPVDVTGDSIRVHAKTLISSLLPNRRPQHITDTLRKVNPTTKDGYYTLQELRDALSRVRIRLHSKSKSDKNPVYQEELETAYSLVADKMQDYTLDTAIDFVRNYGSYGLYLTFVETSGMSRLCKSISDELGREIPVPKPPIAQEAAIDARMEMIKRVRALFQGVDSTSRTIKHIDRQTGETKYYTIDRVQNFIDEYTRRLEDAKQKGNAEMIASRQETLNYWISRKAELMPQDDQHSQDAKWVEQIDLLNMQIEALKHKLAEQQEAHNETISELHFEADKRVDDAVVNTKESLTETFEQHAQTIKTLEAQRDSLMEKADHLNTELTDTKETLKDVKSLNEIFTRRFGDFAVAYGNIRNFMLHPYFLIFVCLVTVATVTGFAWNEIAFTLEKSKLVSSALAGIFGLAVTTTVFNQRKAGWIKAAMYFFIFIEFVNSASFLGLPDEALLDKNFTLESWISFGMVFSQTLFLPVFTYVIARLASGKGMKAEQDYYTIQHFDAVTGEYVTYTMKRIENFIRIANERAEQFIHQNNEKAAQTQRNLAYYWTHRKKELQAKLDKN